MKRILLAILAAVLLTQPASAQTQVSGQWAGLGLQVGPAETWSITMTLRADGSGQIDYPSLECGGTLTRESARGGVVFYREHISYGACVDNGTIGVFPQAGRLMWFWTGEETDYPDMAASAVLYAAGPVS